MDTLKEETFQELVDREKAERQKITKGLVKRFKNIFTILKYNDVLEHEEQDEWAHSARLIGKKLSGESIYLFSSEYNSKFQRIEVRGDYPSFKEGSPYVEVWYDREKDGGKYDKVPSPSITVSVNKTDEQIARDIERRFLPAYLDRLARVQKRVKETNEYNGKTLCSLEQLKAILTGGKGLDKYETERKEFSEYFDDSTRIEVKTSGDQVDINVRCGLDLAEKLARFLKQEVK